MGWKDVLKSEDFQRRIAAEMGLTLEEYKKKIEEETKGNIERGIESKKTPEMKREEEREKNRKEARAKRRKEAGLPEENINGAKLNWQGKCPKCGLRVDKDNNTFENPLYKSKIDVSTWEFAQCPYFRKAGKVEGKFDKIGIYHGVKFREGAIKDLSAADECPMASRKPLGDRYTTKDAVDMYSGNRIRNPHYDPTKEADDI
jgi:hypothetical protein